MMKRQIMEMVARMGACGDGLEWLEYQRSPMQAWRDCRRADWMLWLLGKLSGFPGSQARKKLVLCAARCAMAIPQAKHPSVKELLYQCVRWAEGGDNIDTVRRLLVDVGEDVPYWQGGSLFSPAVMIAVATYSLNGSVMCCPETFSKYPFMADIVRQHYPDCPRVNERRTDRQKVR